MNGKNYGVRTKQEPTMSNNVPTMTKPCRGSRAAMRAFGAVRGGHSGPMPPRGSWVVPTLYVKDDGVTRVFSMQDDGGFVGIGYPDEWHCIIRWKCARMFAWWVLRQWARDWFGLRSWLYFQALHANVRGKWRARYPRSSRLTRKSSHAEWWAER